MLVRLGALTVRQLPHTRRVVGSCLLCGAHRACAAEADAFAAEKSSAKDLITALVKLYQDNAATLTPDPLYSKFYDSHPPAPLRIAHLQELALR